jgi:hypothetical protein
MDVIVRWLASDMRELPQSCQHDEIDAFLKIQSLISRLQPQGYVDERTHEGIKEVLEGQLFPNHDQGMVCDPRQEAIAAYLNRNWLAMSCQAPVNKKVWVSYFLGIYTSLRKAIELRNEWRTAYSDAIRWINEIVSEREALNAGTLPEGLSSHEACQQLLHKHVLLMWLLRFGGETPSGYEEKNQRDAVFAWSKTPHACEMTLYQASLRLDIVCNPALVDEWRQRYTIIDDIREGGGAVDDIIAALN